MGDSARMKKMRRLAWVCMVAISLTCLFAVDDEFIDTGHNNEISRLPESESAEVVFDDSGALSEPAYVPSPQVKEKHVKVKTANRNWHIKEEQARKAEMESKAKREKAAKSKHERKAKESKAKAAARERRGKALALERKRKAQAREKKSKEMKSKEKASKEKELKRRAKERKA